MIGVYKDAFYLYRRRFFVILLLGITFILPLQVFHNVVANYFYIYFSIAGDRFYPMANLFNTFFTLILIPLSQIPFIYMAYQEANHYDAKFGEIYGHTLENAFPVYVKGILYGLLIIFGMLLLVIPGVILAILFFCFPYAVVIENRKWIDAFREAYHFGKQHFWGLLGIIFLFGLAEWVISIGALYGSIYLSFSLPAVSMIQNIINILFIPFMAFTITYFYVNEVS
ncbi:hypothetical protein NWF35_06380 [Polycladomyces subterraneus]|uniref:DUF7847 domain-containing protein n=1 Tax=Polycladomyces subterraneus TaxID=1016997 RepID=A0ABT8IN31_9BACL|nr:hypothetical protein [Polycladomyces subterraneus]